MNEDRHDSLARTPEREMRLELLALEEAFVVEHEAGRSPRLSTLIRRYPQHAEALTAFVTEYLATAAEAAERSVDDPEQVEPARPLSAGTLRGLKAIFGPDHASLRVAEAHEDYAVDTPQDEGSTSDRGEEK